MSVVSSSERVFFSTVFQALSGVVARHRPELVGELQELGVDLTRLQAAYPAEKWAAATDLAARRLFPELHPSVAVSKVGELIVDAYGTTAVGGALLGLLKLLGPRRVANRVSRSFRSANNYAEDRVTEHGPQDFELWTNELHVPFLHQGVIRRALEIIGARSCTVEVIARDATGTTYRCRWD